MRAVVDHRDGGLSVIRLFLAASAGALIIVFAAFWLVPNGAIAAECGKVSWYGAPLQGLKMANGKPFNRHAMTAASWYYPLGTRVRVTAGRRSVVVTITDRGPARRLHRIIDLSEAAFAKLAPTSQGIIKGACMERLR